MSAVSGTAVLLPPEPAFPPRNSPRSGTPPRSRFRGDLEGLRAVAVLLVVADHLFHFPAGGFVGVDVFFVLSGFLITGLLLREIEKSGRISFADFYRRRARRILPAASLVLVVTVAASYLIFRIGRAAGIFTDALWAAVFAGNWQQVLNGTDYMNAGSATSPVQHYWSLGIEEQFYVVWPLLILGLVWLAGRLQLAGRRRLALMGGGLGLVVAASFAFALWETATHPNVAYFSTFSRAWELGLGALLAVAAPLFTSLATRTRVITGWLGLLLIFVAAFALGPGSAFPGPWALLPVAGTLLVVAAGHANTNPAYLRGMMAVANPASRYVGRISFSLYLWHFPVIILLQPLVTGALFPVLALVLMAALSVASYHLVEDPIRKSQWLEPRLHLVGRRVRPSKRVSRNRAIAATTVVATLMSVAMVANARVQDPADVVALPPSPVAPAQSGPVQSGEAQPAPAPDPLAAQTEAIQAALAAEKWPLLLPSLDQFSNAGQGVKASEWVSDGCLGTESAQLADPVANAAHCVYGDPDAERSLVVYGDSVAISYLPGIRAALAQQSWQIHVLTVAGCPVAQVAQTQIGGAAFPECDTFRSWAIGRIAQLQPDLVVMAEYRHDRVLISQATGAAADVERAAGLDATLAQLAGTDATLLLLSAPPEGRLLSTCATRMSSPADCVAVPGAQFRTTVQIEQAAIAKLGPQARHVDTEGWFCADGQCPAFIGSTPMHADQFHLTDAGARQLAPLLAQALAP